jgi:hypothetical protein
VNSVGDLLRDAATARNVERVAARFDRFPVPAGVRYRLGLEEHHGDEGTGRANVPVGDLVVLAGPGVLGTGSVDGLRAFAAAANAPVANTWGAKGVLPWDSPHHMGTCGLQARDFELLGFADYDVIVATGIDAAESAQERFALAPVVALEPGDLARLAQHVTPATAPIRANALYERLSKVAQPGFVDDRVPLHPARAVADLRAALPTGGVVTAEPGRAGLWVARTFPTTEPGSVVVPATSERGIATALALVAALRGVPAIAVTSEPLDHTTLTVLELGTELGAELGVDVWGAGGPIRRAGDHVAQLHAAMSDPGVSIVDVPVDLSLTRKLVDAAGPVVAWGGLAVND